MSTDYSSELETSFDSQLEIESLKWLPWIGKNFAQSKSKIFILGESMKDWNPNDKGNIDKINGNKNLIREMIAKHSDKNSKYYLQHARGLERALFNKKHPCKEKTHTFWQEAAFHNLVLRSMSSIKERPSILDYTKGWSKLLNIATIVGCNKYIFYGTDQRKINSLKKLLKKTDITYVYKKYEKIGRCIPKQISFTYNNTPLDILFVAHPSRYFSWSKYHPLISSFLNKI